MTDKLFPPVLVEPAAQPEGPQQDSSAFLFVKRHELAGRIRAQAHTLVDGAFSQNDVLKPLLYQWADELAALSASRTEPARKEQK